MTTFQVVSNQVVAQAINNQLENEICCDFHPGTSCNRKGFEQFLQGSRSIAKMYLAVHLVPLLLFRRKQLKQDPIRELSKTLWGFIKSILFAGGYTGMVRRTVCLVSQNYKFIGGSNGIAAVVASVTLLCQPVIRQSEIALYTLNKSMEVLYKMAKRRGYPVKVPFGEGIVMAVALAVISYHYIQHPQAIRGSYRAVLDKLLKDV